MTGPVKWSEIEAECGDFRAGFVATFRKYKDQPTDERDANGITVKVTQTSFARHMGIPKTTFEQWLNRSARPGPLAPERVDASARQIVRNNPQVAELAR